MLAAQAIAWALLCVGMLVVERRWGHRVARVEEPAAELSDSLMRLATGAALVVGLVGSVVAGGAIEPQAATLAAGIGAGTLGIALRAASMRALGASFALTPRVAEGQRLVTSGPYAVVRHPGYTALALFILGLELAIGTWIALASTLFVLLALPMRVGVEERLLERHFAAEYGRYRARTPHRFMPGVFRLRAAVAQPRDEEAARG